MKHAFSIVCLILMFAGCGSEPHTVSPGRGVAVTEQGTKARVYPRGGTPETRRHGLWQGIDAEGNLRWEVRYTRGNPSGPYREWDATGQMIATWPYDWDGNLTGWLRWYDDAGESYKFQISETHLPDFDPIGRAADLKQWAKRQ